MASVSEKHETASTPKINWDDSGMRSSYANVCNVSSTREEVALLFGLNQTWHEDANDSEAESVDSHMTVQLTERIILSPFVAKRLHALLGGALEQYEERFGVLEVD